MIRAAGILLVIAVAAFIVLHDTRGGGGAGAGAMPASTERGAGGQGGGANDAREGEASGSVAPEGARLRIIATNDLHGALDPAHTTRGKPVGGAAAMAASIERAERECRSPCVTLLVDAGDMFQGTAESNLAHGRPVVELYNALGYAAAAVGNHEFDWGLDTLRQRMSEARFSILGANVQYRNGRDVQWIPDDTLVERGPYRIGIIGVIGPETYGSTMAANVATLRFAKPAPIVDSLTRELRARGADVVVVLAHSGAFCRKNGTQSCDGGVISLARALRERVDAIVSGHTHTLVDFQTRDVPIVQAQSSGRAVAVLDLAPGASDGDGKDELIAEHVYRVSSGARASPAIEAIIERADARVAKLVNRPVARFATALPRSGEEYPLGNLIADAQRWAGQADVALVNNGGIRTGLQAGTATYGDVFEVQPFGNPLRRMQVSGAALRAYLEALIRDGEPRTHVSGMVIRFDPGRHSGGRVVSVTMADGTPLRDDATYTVVLNEYMATGRDGRILTRDATKNEQLGPSDLDAFVAYLESRPQPVSAPAGKRFISIGKR
ncbi:MAG TPA: 5'-nucleotidase C-terminal domain-containing protein [Gemmatimonadaceae bacterium]|nr:5'-nucleotidase C-terminal domain-containing protein [Gemmatimonadaceae bacterium]